MELKRLNRVEVETETPADERAPSVRKGREETVKRQVVEREIDRDDGENGLGDARL